MARRPLPQEDDDDDDKEYVVTGEELKKLVRLGRKRPMPFAFCPSVGEDASLFATHRKKAAKRIGKATKEDSGQTKVAWGTFVIVDRVMVLTCERELPSIAKKLKRHMRAERLPLNIRVLDATGKELESDIEDLSGEDDPFADLDDEDAGGDHLQMRLAAIKDAALAATGIAGDRLRDLFAAALRATEAGSRDKAQRLVALVEADVRRLSNSGGRPRVVARAVTRAVPQAPPEVEVPEKEPTPDPAAIRHDTTAAARRVAALRPRVAALEAPVADRLTAALRIIARQLRAGQPEGAGDALDRIEAALERVEARAQG